MDALRDPSCLRDLLLSSPLERFGHGRFAVTAIAPKQASDFSRGRYKFRLFFFIGSGSRPVMAVNLESDLLGTWRMTATTAEGSKIVASFDEAPDYEAFKALALGAADAEALGPPKISHARTPKARSP